MTHLSSSLLPHLARERDESPLPSGKRAAARGTIRCACSGCVVYVDSLLEKGEVVTTVIVEPNGSFESALRRFKKQCEDSRLIPGSRQRLHHEKPSVKRKRTTLAAREKARKRQRMSG